MKNVNDKNFVVLFKTIKNGDDISYSPVDVLIGKYDDNSHIFYDINNTPYKHLIEMPGSFGFAFRTEVEDKIKKFHNLPFPIIKVLLLSAIKKYEYLLTTIEDTNTPAIIIINKKNNEQELLLEDDALMYYQKKYPAFIKLLENVNNDEEVEEIEVDIKSLYKSITDNIIDQDKQIKILLSSIWKQYNEFSNEKSRNILIDGNTAVGKTAIIKNIINNSNIPIIMTSITDFTPNNQAGSITDLLFLLLDKANGNIENAQRGIIVIDDIDKITDNDYFSLQYSKYLQEEIIKLSNSKTIDLIYDYGELSFDTSNLLIIVIGNFSRSYQNRDKIVGFDRNDVSRDTCIDSYIQLGLLPEFISIFPNIIKMNDLNYDSYIKILKKSKTSALNLNKEYYKKLGIDLCYNDDLVKRIASTAVSRGFGARTIDEMIEKTLSLATFEIANNPKSYSKLIINEETIDNNEKYRLVRKRKHN